MKKFTKYGSVREAMNVLGFLATTTQIRHWIYKTYNRNLKSARVSTIRLQILQQMQQRKEREELATLITEGGVTTTNPELIAQSSQPTTPTPETTVITHSNEKQNKIKRVDRATSFRIAALLASQDTKKMSYDDIIALVKENLKVVMTKDAIKILMKDAGIPLPEVKRVYSNGADRKIRNNGDRMCVLAKLVRDLYVAHKLPIPDVLKCLIHRDALPDDVVKELDAERDGCQSE